MNTVKKFIHSIPTIFQSDVEREERLRADLEKAQQDRLKREWVFSRYATFKDQLTTAKANHDFTLSRVERLANWSVQNLYDTFAAGGMTTEELGTRLSQVESVSKHLPEIKKSLWAKIVSPHEIALTQFEKENAAVLKGVKLEQSEPPAFTPTKLDRDHYVNGASGELVRKNVGIY